MSRLPFCPKTTTDRRRLVILIQAPQTDDMSESTAASCNFHSLLKSNNSTTFTWKIDGFKRFLEQHADMYLSMNEIMCEFKAGLDANKVPISWTLYFHSTAETDTFLRLQRQSDGPKVFVVADIVILNSSNINVFSAKSHRQALGHNGFLWFNLGTLDDLKTLVTDGPLTVQCTIDVMVWNNVKTTREISPAAADEAKNKSLATDFKKLLESGDNADVSLKLSDGKVLPAHKAVLSARSPVFKSMFSTEMKEAKENVVDLVDIGEEAMAALLSYIYTGELDLEGKSLQSLRELVDGADKYQLDEMMKLCDESLPELCDAQNSFELLKLARLHRLEDAESRISSFIEMHITNILKSTTNLE